jgi:hypothetical protein
MATSRTRFLDEDRLDLDGVHIGASGDDEILRTVEQVQVPALVEPTEFAAV